MRTEINVTFVKDCEPRYESGWEAYPKGAKATLPGGAALVTLGYAREGWAQPEPAWVETTVEEYLDLPPEWDAPSLESLTVKQLRKRLKAEGLPIRGNKAALIKRLRGD
jgi:hypothetical protein